MLATRSRVTTDDSGWTWLEPDRRSLTLRHAVVSFILSVLFVAAAAAATLPPPVVAVPAFAAILGAGVALARRTWQETQSRVGVSALGVLVQQGTRQDQLSWAAVRAVTGQPHGRRVRILVATPSGQIRTRATYSLAPTRRWLETCSGYARTRRLEPEPAPTGLGFVSGDRPR